LKARLNDASDSYPVAMQVRQRATDGGIARAGEPACALERKLVHVGAQRIDEE
jgi:hypothetical protein